MSLRFTSRLVVALFLLSTIAQPQATPPNYSSQGSEKTKKGDKSGKEEKPPEGESLKEIKTTKGPGLAADPTAVVVALINGDRLSGTGMQIKGGQFKMHADLAGDVSIPVTQVKTFTLADQVMVITKEGVMAANKVSMEKPGQVQLDQASTARTIPANTIRGIYPKTEYDHQVSEGWKPWLGWHGALTGGLSLVDGGDLSSTYTQDVHATREVPDVAGLPVKTRTNFSLGTQMGHGSTTGFRFRVFDAGLRQDFFTSARGFPFVYAQLDHIYSQKLYLQQLYGGGYGYDLVRRSNWHFTAESGLLYARPFLFSLSQQCKCCCASGRRSGSQTGRAIADQAFPAI